MASARCPVPVPAASAGCTLADPARFQPALTVFCCALCHELGVIFCLVCHLCSTLIGSQCKPWRFFPTPVYMGSFRETQPNQTAEMCLYVVIRGEPGSYLWCISGPPMGLCKKPAALFPLKCHLSPEYHSDNQKDNH